MTEKNHENQGIRPTQCGDCDSIYVVPGASRDMDKFFCRVAPPITHFVAAPNSIGMVELQQHTAHVPVLEMMLSCRFFKKRLGDLTSLTFGEPPNEPPLLEPLY